MIEYKIGNILAEDAEAIVNTVNCVGVMGRGIALQFKKAFPENFKSYSKACNRKEVKPGQMFIHDMGGLVNPRYIINFPTKRHWRGKSRMEDVDAGLEALKVDIRQLKIRSIAIPPLGSGLGGLNWADVKQRIENSFSDMDDIRIVVYEPNDVPAADKKVKNIEVPKMTTGRAVLVELVQRYLAGLLDPSVTLLEVHKLMYFMQEAGEPLRLKYTKAHYGPYAENLRHVLIKIEGHLVSGYADGGDIPDKPLQLVPGAVDDASNFLKEYPETRKKFDKVTQLVEGFESPYGLELLATVHWVVNNENADTIEDVVTGVHSWSERKSQFTSRQIGVAVDVLSKKGWIAQFE